MSPEMIHTFIIFKHSENNYTTNYSHVLDYKKEMQVFR